jgi:hypothetical protein
LESGIFKLLKTEVKPIDNIPKKKHCNSSKNKKDGTGKCRAVNPGGIAPERRLEVTG